jgi:hypothetical protein
MPPALAPLLVDAFERGLSAAPASARLHLWLVLDAALKAGPAALLEATRSRVVGWARYAPQAALGGEAQVRACVESLRRDFGTVEGTLLAIEFKSAAAAAASTVSNGAAAPTMSVPAAAPAASDVPPPAGTSNSNQLTIHQGLRTIGGFVSQSGNNRRPMGAGALQVKTRDSLMAVTMAATYAPAAPAELPVYVPQRDADAPIGYMRAPEEGADARYREAQKRRYEAMLKRIRTQDEERDAAADAAHAAQRRRLDGDAAAAAAAEAAQQPPALECDRATWLAKCIEADPWFGLIAPQEFRRDEHGVRVGNFPAGVRFIRDAIFDCGGAIELLLLEQRVTQLVDENTRAEYGNLREFVHIHAATFRVEEEDGRFVVRLTPEQARRAAFERGVVSAASALQAQLSEEQHDDAAPTDRYTWREVICPFCSHRMLGRNFAKHAQNRRCVGMQLFAGFSGAAEGGTRSAITALAAAAMSVMRPRAEVDDDDLAWFAECVETAACVPRFRFASPNAFSPVLKALRVLRDRFLDLHGAASTSAVRQPLDANTHDAGYVAVFRAFGRNMLRLPIAWIDTGDVIDICHPFTSQLLQPAVPPPAPGDPRIRIGNSYPGMLLAESDPDTGDAPSEDERSMSDDEGPQFQFAPPVTVVETVMAAGVPREMKRLAYRLHTAPPVPAERVIEQTTGGSTLRAVHNAMMR